MTDFYEELKLQNNWGLDEINKNLNQLENTWRKREITNPEKATKMLALIIDARAAFKNEATRSEYDRALKASKDKPKKTDPNAARMASFDKWYNDARQFKLSNQHDLAKTAIDKAMEFRNPDADDSDFFWLAAEIYMENHDYITALNYINKAIVVIPDETMYYVTKALIFDRQGSAAYSRKSWDESTSCYTKHRETLQTAFDKAEKSGHDYYKCITLGMLAFAWYFHPNPDNNRAEMYAKQSIALGEDYGNAKRVLDDINAKRAEAERKAEEQRIAKEESDRRAREAKERFDRETRERQEREARQKRRKREVTAMFAISWIVFIACIAFSIYRIVTYSWNSYHYTMMINTIMAVGCTAFLCFSAAIKNHYSYRGTSAALWLSAIWAFVHAFIAGQARSTIYFVNWEPMKAAGTQLLIFFIAIAISNRIGSAIGKASRQ